MRGWTTFFLSISAVAGLLALVIAYEVAVWNECRAQSSWLYCWRVLHDGR